MYTLQIFTEDDRVEGRLVRGVDPFQTLLEVCLNYSIELRHDCGGVCHCTTCHVYVEKGLNFLSEPSRREIDFLRRCANGRPNSRLACQSMLEEGQGTVEILIPLQKEE